MDRKLIDEALVDLLRMDDAKRTPEKIHAHLTLAATAAGIRLDAGAPLQLEHMKLHSAVALLAGGLGGSFTHRTNLRLGPGLEGLELFASVEATGGNPRFTAFGNSAERVLANLRREISQHGMQIEQQAPKPRFASRDPLRHLPKPGKDAA